MIKLKKHSICTVVLLAFIMMLPLLAPIKAVATTGTATAAVDGHTYTYSYDTATNTAEITAFTRGSSTMVIIPAYFGEYKVTSIKDGQIVVMNSGGGPFFSKGLTSVAIPDGITYIGKYAFYRNSLSSITIPASVTEIGEAAFGENNTLTSVVILNSTTEISYSINGTSFPANPNLAIYGYALNSYGYESTAKVYADAKGLHLGHLVINLG